MAEGLEFAMRYPFSDSARAAISGMQLDERIVGLATERLLKAIRGDRSAKLLLHDQDRKDDIASFAAARMILGHLRNQYLTNVFAVNEAKRVRDCLDRDDSRAVDAVAAQFGIATAGDGRTLTVDLPTYLRYSTRNPHYRLINRRLVNGRVEVTYDEKKRLVEEAVKKHMESVPLVKDPPDIIKAAGAKLVAELPKTETRVLGEVKAGDHPPCVMRLIDEMNKHTNLPHQARLYLATYFLAIGSTEDEIAAMFSALPDYAEKVTRYQVGHIRRKGYNVPSCATVMTYGLCCAVCRIGSPLNWHSLDEGRKKTIRGSGAGGGGQP
jgi:DNA primase large subunit